MIRLTPSILEAVRLYLTTDWMDEARLVRQLTEKEPPSVEMLAGSEFGDRVNSAPTQTSLVESTLLEEGSARLAEEAAEEMRTDISLGLDPDAHTVDSWTCEVPARRSLRPSAINMEVDDIAFLSGRCDDICGSTVVEYKLTGRVDLLGYADSIQWRCYAWLYDADRVVYMISQRYGKAPPFKVSAPVSLPLSTYPGIRDDIEALAAEAIRVAFELGCLESFYRETF